MLRDSHDSAHSPHAGLDVSPSHGDTIQMVTFGSRRRLMADLECIKPESVRLNDHRAFNEIWLQDRVADDGTSRWTFRWPG